MDSVECPLCGARFPADVIAAHASTCEGVPPPSSSDQTAAAPAAETEDSDLALARRLQAEFDAQQPAQHKTVRCELCRGNVTVDDLYILDECSHRFCRDCLVSFVADKLATSVAIACPVAGCAKPLSVRDMKDLVPRAAALAKKKQPSSSGGRKPPRGGGGGSGSSRRASQRIMEELRHINASSPEKNGYSVEPVEDNIYLWEVQLFDFDKAEPIAKDLAHLRMRAIVMRISFPEDYPFSPPFCRIVRPRFVFHTGHVTVGGSICNELLSAKGWSPENTIESVIMSIRSSFLAGGGRLERHHAGDYTEAEARVAFDRLIAQHGWQ